MKKIKNYFNNKVKLIEPKIHKDNRGYFSEVYNKKGLLKIGIKNNFVQDNYSFSKSKFTFRGIHLQTKPFQQAKIVSVLSGSIIDYIVDLRFSSKTYGKSIFIKLSDNNLNFIFIPEGFGHGFLTLKKNTIVKYKVSNLYSYKNSLSIYPLDKDLNLNFFRYDSKKFIISQNDKMGLNYIDFKKKYLKK